MSKTLLTRKPDDVLTVVAINGGILRVWGGADADVIRIADGNLLVSGAPHSLADVVEVRI